MNFYTTFGKVSVRETLWRLPGRSYYRPLPQRLGVTQLGLSGRLEKVLADFGLEGPFGLGAQRLHYHYGFALCKERVRCSTHKQAKEQAAAQDAREPVRTLPAQGADKVVAQADGSMVCTVQTGSEGDRRKQRCISWREVRLEAARASGSASTHYEATMGSVDEAGQLLAQAARRAGWAVKTYVQAMGDGAPWIADQAAIQLPGSTFLLDLYHVCEHLGPAANACARKEPSLRWLKRQKNKLLKGKAVQVIAELAAKSEPESVPDPQAPVRCAHRYLSSRAGQLDYPNALSLGLPVGSGLIESGHKHVIQARLKGPGMAWLAENAEAIAKARAWRATYGVDGKSLPNAA